MSIDRSNVAIIVFAMPGCPACHDYLPRLYRQAEGFRKLGHPLVVYDNQPTQLGEIPIVVVDSTSADESVIALADQHEVHALPTTIVLHRYRLLVRTEGSLSNEEIYSLLNTAVSSNW